MDCKRLMQQPRTTRELPIAFVGADYRAQFAHAPLIKRQRPADLEIGYLEHGGIRPSPPGGGKSHLDDRRRRKDRHSFYRVIAYPRQNLFVEMVEPAGYRAALTKAEKRVVEGRIYEI